MARTILGGHFFDLIVLFLYNCVAEIGRRRVIINRGISGNFSIVKIVQCSNTAGCDPQTIKLCTKRINFIFRLLRDGLLRSRRFLGNVVI